MKAIIVMLALVMCIHLNGHAQSWSEWFSQDKTQKKYLLQQIAALEVYLVDVKEGYHIINAGINNIHQFKQGEFKLHQDYFNSLKAVKPKLKDFAMVSDILAIQVEVENYIDEAKKQAKMADLLSKDEKAYLQNVFKNLHQKCLEDLDELQLMITDGKLKLNDDERSQKIAAIYSNMKQKQAFIMSFTKELQLLVKQRSQEQNQLKTLQEFYELK